MYQIKDITEIKSGVFCKSNPLGDIRLLQATDYALKGELKDMAENTTRVLFEPKFEKHILKDGDILLASKGVNIYSVVYRQKELPAIASSSFFVINVINPEVVLPEFISWFLNTQEVIDSLKAKSKGTAIQSINKPVVEDIILKIPSIKQQKLIIEISNLLKQEKKINEKISNLKQQLLIGTVR